MKLFAFGFLLMGLGCTTHAYLIYGGMHQVNAPGNADQPGNCAGRRCLSSEANCRTGKCGCLRNYQGDGILNCFPPTMYSCCTKNDPNVNSFTNETYRLDSPCRSLMASYKYYYPSKPERNNGYTCSVNVYNFGERMAGKIYSGGFEVYIDVDRRGQSSPNQLRFRGFGIVEEQHIGWRYVFQMLIKDSTGSWEDAQSNPNVGVGYSVTHHEHNNKRIVFESEECQLMVTWRPPYPGQGAEQVRTPGLCIGVEGSGPGELEWPNDEDTICRSPGGTTMESFRASMNLNSRDEAALKLSLLKTNQWPSFIAEQCDPLADDVEDCKAANLAGCQAGVNYCSFLLSHEHAVSCLSAGDTSPLGNQVADYFRGCFNAVCSDSRAHCLAIRTAILSSSPCTASDFTGWPLTVAACNALPNP